MVPLLVLLPIIETQAGSSIGLTEQLSLVGATVAKGVGGLGVILVAGRFLLRPLFDVVAGERIGVCWKVSAVFFVHFQGVGTGHNSRNRCTGVEW